MTGWRLVAWREMVQRARSKAFVLSSLVVMAIAVAGVVLSAVLQDDGRTRVDVAVVTGPAGSSPAPGAAPVPSGAEVAQALPAIGQALSLDVRVRTVADRVAGEALVDAGDADVLVAGTEAVWKRRVSPVQQALVQAAVQSVARRDAARAAGIDDATLARVLAPVDVQTATLRTRDRDESVRAGAAAVGLVLLFMSVQVHGAAVLMGVVEEKSSRVVEVLLGRVRPRALLLGKVLGIGAVGLAQVVLTAAAALVALVAVRSIDVPKVPPDTIVWFVVWFVLGFALYATVFAGLGSLVSRQEDAQTVVMPATLPLLASYIVSFAVVEDPGSLLARITSIVPVTSPMVMPVRLATGSPAVWEIVASIVLVVAAIAVVLRLAGRLYEHNVLRTGSRVGLRETWRSLRA